MRTLLTILFSFIASVAIAQVPQPTMFWLKGIGGGADDNLSPNTVKTQDGGFIVNISTYSGRGVGNIDSFCTESDKRQVFIKYNADATAVEWSKCYEKSGDSVLSYLFPTLDGGAVLAGNYLSTINGGFVICKESPTENIVWSHTYSKGNSLVLTCMLPTDDGGYIMAGRSYYSDTNALLHYGSWMNADYFILKLDSNGNKLWAKIIGGTGNDYIYAITDAPNHGYYIGGSTASNDLDCTGNNGLDDVYLARTDSNGNLLWHLDIGGSDIDYAKCMIGDGGGGVIIAAVSSSTDGDVTNHINPGENIWIISVDSGGHVLWNKCYGGGGDCYPNSICKAADGSIWIAGVHSNSSGGEVDTAYGRDDAWFVHTDNAGNLINARVLGSHTWDRGMLVYPLPNGNVIAGGFYGAGDGAFSTVYYGSDDVFLAELGPYNQAAITNINGKGADIKMYPNPASAFINLETGQENVDVLVTDAVGRALFSARLTEKLQVPVNAWAKGIYFVQMRDGEGGKAVRRLIVQ